MRRVGALILAAGGSTRFGEPKQFLKFEGESLIRRVVCAAVDASCGPLVIVAGDQIEKLRDHVSGCEVIHNAQWQRGIGTSIGCGIAQLRNKVDAVVILACDQPLVSADLIRTLIAQCAPIVASSYADTLGIPAYFEWRYFGALSTLADDKGAKSLIEAHASEVATVAFPEGAIDIDTRADYDAIRSAGSLTLRNNSRSAG